MRASWVVLLTAVSGCGRDVAPRPEPKLLVTSANSAIVKAGSGVLVEQQKDLFRALVAGDQQTLARLIDIGFTWGHGERRVEYDSAGLMRVYGRPTPAYFTAAAGALRPASTQLPASFVVEMSSVSLVTVTAFFDNPPPAPVSTIWRRTNAGWRAIHISAGYLSGVPAKHVLDVFPSAIQVRNWD